jgi:hypothetical protein
MIPASIAFAFGSRANSFATHLKSISHCSIVWRETRATAAR